MTSLPDSGVAHLRFRSAAASTERPSGGADLDVAGQYVRLKRAGVDQDLEDDQVDL